MTAPVWLTVPEVAGRLRVSRMTVYRLVHDGTIPSIRVGRGFRINPIDLDVFLREAKTTAGGS